jgi:hypothetical protein
MGKFKILQGLPNLLIQAVCFGSCCQLPNTCSCVCTASIGQCLDPTNDPEEKATLIGLVVLCGNIKNWPRFHVILHFQILRFCRIVPLIEGPTMVKRVRVLAL